MLAFLSPSGYLLGMRPIILLMLSLCCAGGSLAGETLKVMTFNLRYASTNKPNSWPERRPVMKQCLTEADADIIGTQEGVYYQLKDIHADAPQYQWIGLGRDGGSRGEFMAVFYKQARFEPLEYDHFWLSDTPEVIASTTWGNSNRRMVTWVRFLDKQSNGQFYFVNTHLDHQIQPAREKAAELIKTRLQALKTNLPIILLGDFNATAGKNKAYSTLTENFLMDTWHIAAERRGRVVATFHGFNGPREGDDRIDWILTTPGVKALWTAISTCAQGNQFPSDHFPVIAELTW